MCKNPWKNFSLPIADSYKIGDGPNWFGDYSYTVKFESVPELDIHDVINKAYEYVDGMVDRADKLENGYTPMWYGWALREAFIAGTKYKVK